MCIAFLNMVDQEAHPATHQVLAAASRFTGVAAVTLETGAQFGNIFGNPGSAEHPPVTTGSGEITAVSENDIMSAIGYPDSSHPK